VGEVIVLLIIAAAWLLLLVLVLGMFQVATGTSMPRPVSAAPFTLPGNNVAPLAGPGPTKGARHAVEAVSAEAA
jgi:hypothetical protein